jgi:hypothetical protein
MIIPPKAPLQIQQWLPLQKYRSVTMARQKAHRGGLEAHGVAMEARQGAMEDHHVTIEAHHGGSPRRRKGSPWPHGGSSRRHEAHNGAV